MEFKVKGLDIGYNGVKDDEGNIFKSSMTQLDTGSMGGYRIVYRDKTYYVGVGSGTVDANKSDLELTKLCMMTNLAIDSADEFAIVTGLPIKQYGTQKDKLKESLMLCNDEVILCNGIEKKIIIQDMIIYPQCAGALLSSDIREDVIVVDIGGHTIDIGYFSFVNGKFNLERCDTLYEGMLVLYGKIVDAINNHFELTFEPKFAESILTKGLLINGEKQDINFLNDTLQEHMKPIYDQLSLHYPIKAVKSALCGGGSIPLKDVYFGTYPNTVIIDDCQFANAKGFKKLGDIKFKHLIEKNSGKCIPTNIKTMTAEEKSLQYEQFRRSMAYGTK